ncbi:MAG TPA: DinB family protein [Cyclobacteriaceae bacterium]
MNHIKNFKQLYESGAWFGDTYMEKLADVTEKEAFTPPVKGVHTIAELVAHVIYWRSPIIKKLKGQKDYVGSVDSPENWVSLDKLKAKGWKAILNDFSESQKQLTTLLETTKPSFLKEEYSPGNSWDYVVDGIMQHDVYHLGQLALVKKMIRM